MLPIIMDRLRMVTPKIVMTEYISPKAKNLLIEAQISYADAAGNLFLTDDQLYIYVENRKAEKKEAVTGNRAFTKAGLKLLFLLLQHPHYIQEPYRFLAERAEVGLDTINKVFKALRKEKYIIPVNNREFQWNKREELLTNWVEGYKKNLKPKLRMKTFKALEKGQDWKTLRLPENTCWGGANAGDFMTGYLIADHWTLYTNMDFMSLMKELKWIPDPEGNITVFERFWKEENPDAYVPLLIAYADLTEGDDPGYIKTANMIYEKYLQRLL